MKEKILIGAVVVMGVTLVVMGIKLYYSGATRTAEEPSGYNKLRSSLGPVGAYL